MVYDEALREAEADGIPVAGQECLSSCMQLSQVKVRSAAAKYIEKGVPSLLVKLQMGGTTLLCRKRVARVPEGQPLRSVLSARQVLVPYIGLSVSCLQAWAGSS